MKFEGIIHPPVHSGSQKTRASFAKGCLPDRVETSVPDSTEFLHHLILCYLKAHGYGSASEIAWLRDGLKSAVQTALMAMSSDLLTKPLARSRVRILSSFDNLVTQRKRLDVLFNYDYQLDC